MGLKALHDRAFACRSGIIFYQVPVITMFFCLSLILLSWSFDVMFFISRMFYSSLLITSQVSQLKCPLKNDL